MKIERIQTTVNNKNSTQLSNFKPVLLATEIIGIIVLLIHSLVVNKPPIFDEIFYVKDVVLLNKLGISFKYLTLSKTAAGPLTAIIHYLLQPFTHLEASWMRVVNVVLLALTIITLSISLQLLFSKNPFSHAFSIIAIPMTWVISGMSLSEIPAMFFATSGILCLLLVIESKDKKQLISISSNQKLLIAALGGLLFSFSILGRQTFLVVEIALPILAIFNLKNIRYITIFTFLSLLLPLIVFMTWGGLIPPSHLVMEDYIGARSLVEQSSISLANGFLSFSYMGIATLIVAPLWFNFGKKTLLIFLTVFTAITTININLKLAYTTPMASIAKSVFSENIVALYSHVVSSLILSIGVVFLLATLKNMWQRKQDYIFMFLCLSLLLISGTTFKIVHQFSSRYVATAIPFLLLVTDQYSVENYWKLARVILGSLLGFMILRSFFIAH